MLTYVPVFLLSAFALNRFLPFLHSPLYADDRLAQAFRAYIVLFLALKLTDFIWKQKFVPKLRIDSKNKAVLVTGCDTGFGNLLARKLDRNGFKVFACCLFPEKADAQRLERECSSRLEIIKMDVTSDADVEAAYESVEKSLKEEELQLQAVVNNAGIIICGEADFGRTLAPFERQINVNCLGTIRVTKAFSSLLRRCETSPRLICVTSLAALISLPGMIGYCVSKRATLAFVDGIRRELMKWNVKVVSVEPHLFRTNLVTSEVQHKALQELWDSSRPITRKDYGQEFFEGAKRLLDRGIADARDNIPDVVEALYDSVTIKHPEAHKRVFGSTIEALRAWFLLEQIPYWVQDLLIHYGTAFVTGKPAGVAIERSSGKRMD